MKREELNRWVGGALEFVPKQKGCQNEFRMVLAAMLKNGLGPRPEQPGGTVAEVVSLAVQRTRGTPSFDSRLLQLEWPARHGETYVSNPRG
jgi:hypothetical protein